MVSQGNVFTSVLNQNFDKTLQIAKNCALFACEKKAENITVLAVSNLTSYADYFVICSATSERHAQALARTLIDAVKDASGTSPLGVEGLLEGSWILVDFGDVVCHVFTEQSRDYYDLDGLWADAKNIDFRSKKDIRLEAKTLQSCDS